MPLMVYNKNIIDWWPRIRPQLYYTLYILVCHMHAENVANSIAAGRFDRDAATTTRTVWSGVAGDIDLRTIFPSSCFSML